MNEPGTNRAEVELTEPWSEPVYRPGAVAPAAVAPRSAPAGAMSPPHGIQAFSAVPLPASHPEVEAIAAAAPARASSRNIWLLGGAVLGLILLGSAIGFGVLAAVRSPAPVVTGPSRLEAIQRGLARQRASNRPAAVAPSAAAAPAKVASARAAPRAKSAPVAKPVKQVAAPQPQAAASSKPSAPSRPAKFADEPADPD